LAGDADRAVPLAAEAVDFAGIDRLSLQPPDPGLRLPVRQWIDRATALHVHDDLWIPVPLAQGSTVDVE
jgi:hypothetical protein